MTISLDGADTSRVAQSPPRVSLLRAIAGIVTSVIAIAVFVTVAWMAAVGGDPSTLFMRWFGVRHDFAALYTSLGIAPLPGDAMTSTVYDKFLKLESEPCDFAAMNAAAKNLTRTHHERIAATALQGFARRCNDDPRAGREASGILFRVGDFEAARHGFADLVARFPQNELDWYHKGQTEAGLKRNDDALGMLALIGLDAVRFDWSSVPLWARLVGALLLFVSVWISMRVFRENSFASPVVKIQTDRGHKAITSGPYRYVRHPMYSGALLFFIGMTLQLGSWWGLAGVVVLAVLFAIRTTIEEKALRAGLIGYDAYAARVRYRLIPAVW